MQNNLSVQTPVWNGSGMNTLLPHPSQNIWESLIADIIWPPGLDEVNFYEAKTLAITTLNPKLCMKLLHYNTYNIFHLQPVTADFCLWEEPEVPTRRAAICIVQYAYEFRHNEALCKRSCWHENSYYVDIIFLPEIHKWITCSSYEILMWVTWYSHEINMLFTWVLQVSHVLESCFPHANNMFLAWDSHVDSMIFVCHISTWQVHISFMTVGDRVTSQVHLHSQ